jgi:endonuclease/exonuclease/phosphatase family metal-dependent hydrolase
MIARELGCRDLIKEYGITSTRTSLYPKPNKFADYVFVSKGIEIVDFKILSDEISDHTPLELEIR